MLKWPVTFVDPDTSKTIVIIHDPRFKNSPSILVTREVMSFLLPSRCTWHTLRLHAHAHSTSACYTRLTHARRVHGVRAERGGMRYGILLFAPPPPLPLLLSHPLPPSLVGPYEWQGGWWGRGWRGDEEGSPHPTDPRHPRSPPAHSPSRGFSSLEILLPLSPCQPYSALSADSRTHLPPVPTLGALTPDVTSRVPRRTPSPRVS